MALVCVASCALSDEKGLEWVALAGACACARALVFAYRHGLINSKIFSVSLTLNASFTLYTQLR